MYGNGLVHELNYRVLAAFMFDTFDLRLPDFHYLHTFIHCINNIWHEVQPNTLLGIIDNEAKS